MVRHEGFSEGKTQSLVSGIRLKPRRVEYLSLSKDKIKIQYGETKLLTISFCYHLRRCQLHQNKVFNMQCPDWHVLISLENE